MEGVSDPAVVESERWLREMRGGGGGGDTTTHSDVMSFVHENSVSGGGGGDSTSEAVPDESCPECDRGAEGVEELPLDGTAAVELPATVRVLEAAGGGRVYLVGTAHFSRESQEDVARVIREVEPQVVMVELCEQRTNILLVDEETILREAGSIDLNKIRSSVRQSGVFNGLMYILLLNMSAHLTRELGMAPGGEFRTALREARKLRRCTLQLGDRPIDITLQRALAALSWWQSVRLAWHLLTSDMDISAEEVERCKQKKMLEEMLEEMAGEFPELKRVFVEERDLYLAHSLHISLAAATATTAGAAEPRVVGVVGIGHVEGIAAHWGRVSSRDIPPLLRVPEPALSTRVVRVTVKLAAAGAVLYLGYKLLPKRLLTR